MVWFDSHFRDKAVLITGASSGIGRAAAIAFGGAGARVAIVARRRALLEEVAAEVGRAGGEALVLPADVTRRKQIRETVREAARALGGLDVVVNNAGLLLRAPVSTMRIRDLQAMIRVNVFGMLAVMQEAVRVMRRQAAGGVIVNVDSLGGRRGLDPMGGYCATKFALIGLTEALRLELRDTPIDVALVLPGLVETAMVDDEVYGENFGGLWPSQLKMDPSWVVWAIFAAARFRLVEISVPPGAAMVEKLAALAPGLADSFFHWSSRATQWLARHAPSTAR